MRIVVDTNVMVSALLYPQRTLGAFIDFIKDGTFQLVYSQSILSEYIDVLHRLKIPATAITEFTKLVREKGFFVIPQPIDLCPISDPDDVIFLEAALGGNARVIISGDRHLKELRIYQGIPILNPRDFLTWVAQG